MRSWVGFSFCENCESSGNSFWQTLHQGAQKISSVGCPFSDSLL